MKMKIITIVLLALSLLAGREMKAQISAPQHVYVYLEVVEDYSGNQISAEDILADSTLTLSSQNDVLVTVHLDSADVQLADKIIVTVKDGNTQSLLSSFTFLADETHTLIAGYAYHSEEGDLYLTVGQHATLDSVIVDVILEDLAGNQTPVAQGFYPEQ